MKPLVTNRQCLILLCICPADERTSRRQKLAYYCCATIALFGLIGGFISNLSFARKFLSIDVGQAMYAFTFLFDEFAVLYMTLVGMILLRQKIATIFDNLSGIYKARKWNFLGINLNYLLSLTLFRWKCRFISLFGPCKWYQRMDMENFF